MLAVTTGVGAAVGGTAVGTAVGVGTNGVGVSAGSTVGKLQIGHAVGTVEAAVGTAVGPLTVAAPHPTTKPTSAVPMINRIEIIIDLPFPVRRIELAGYQTRWQTRYVPACRRDRLRGAFELLQRCVTWGGHDMLARSSTFRPGDPNESWGRLFDLRGIPGGSSGEPVNWDLSMTSESFLIKPAPTEAEVVDEGKPPEE